MGGRVIWGSVAGLVVAAVAFAGCGGGAATQSRGTTTATREGAASQRCPPDGATRLSDGRHALAHDGVERSYLVDVPTEAAGSPMPLIVALHGHGSSAAELEAKTHLGAVGAEDGYLVVTPDALNRPARWNFDRRPDGPDDFGFIDALVTRLEHQVCIDPARVFVAGSSNGAAFAGLLTCTPPYRFAAVAMVIATVPTTGCRADATPSVLTIRGTEDAHVPFDGTPAAIAQDAERHGCDPEPAIDHPAPDVQRTRYDGCRNGGAVVLDAVIGGTHAWPAPGPDDATGHYRATDQVLAFFSQVEAAN